MPLAFPAVEKRAERDAPVTVEPCPDELLRAGSPQPLLVRLNVYVLVVVDLRRDEHPLEPSHRIADDAVAQGRRIDVARLDPLMPRPARVSRRTQTDWHACAGAQRRHQLHHWGGAREIPDLLYINSRVVVALVHVGISIALQIGEAQPGAVRRTPHLFGFVELPFQRPVDRPRPLHSFHELGARAAHHQADRVLAIAAGMSAELAEHAVSLAAASSAAEEDLEHLALQQPQLGRVAERRPNNTNPGLRDHGVIFSSAPSVRPDVPRTPSLSTKRKSSWRSITTLSPAIRAVPALPLPIQHCPSAPGSRSRIGALSPPHAIASACPSHDPARPPQLPHGQHKAHGVHS